MAETIISQLDRVFANPLETNRQVNFISDRDAISALKRWEGMQVYVKSELTTYELRGGILNEHWTDISGIDSANYTPTGGYAGTAQDIVDSIQITTGGIENISITHIENLDYYVIANPYKINTEYYIAAPTTVTLTVGDATYARIDVIYADVNGVIGVLEGTPSASPIKPIVDPNTQRELTFRTVPALATVDPLVTNELVFDENTGIAGGEWDILGSGLTALNFNSTAVAFSGTKSIYFDGVNPYFNADFQSDVNISLANISTFYFRVYLTEVININAELIFQLQDTSLNIAGSARIVKDGYFGLDRNVLNAWQIISIPIEFFNFPYSEFKGIRFSVSKSIKPKMYMDMLQFQFNVAQPDLTPTIYELTSNKKTDIEANKTSNTFFASVKAIYDWAVGLFQPLLVSGTNIKTINSTSLLGSGDIAITNSPYSVSQTPDNGTYGLLAGTVNGTNTVFTTDKGIYIAGSLVVYLDGQLMTQGGLNDYTETNPSIGTFTFVTAPPSGSIITAMYNDGEAIITDLSIYKLKTDNVKIEPWTAKTYLLNDQVNHLGKDWVANANTLSTDVPGTSSKWVNRLSGMANGIVASGNADAVSGGEVFTAISNAASGSPKGSFINLTALETSIPSGDSNIYVTIDNGHWYYYNLGWQDGGLYQSPLTSTIKSNESLALAQRKGDVLYGIIDQYTGEEITLSKVTGTPTIDGIIYFQLGSEYFKRNYTKITPEMFGAFGDGLTDDILPIQSMLDTFGSTAIGYTYQNNSEIFEFKNNKTYLISDTIYFYGHQTLNFNYSKIIYTGIGTAICKKLTLGTLFTAYYTTINNLILESETFEVGISLQGCNNALLKNCVVYSGSKEDNIICYLLKHGGSNEQCYFNIIDNCNAYILGSPVGVSNETYGIKITGTIGQSGANANRIIGGNYGGRATYPIYISDINANVGNIFIGVDIEGWDSKQDNPQAVFCNNQRNTFQDLHIEGYINTFYFGISSAWNIVRGLSAALTDGINDIGQNNSVYGVTGNSNALALNLGNATDLLGSLGTKLRVASDSNASMRIDTIADNTIYPNSRNYSLGVINRGDELSIKRSLLKDGDPILGIDLLKFIVDGSSQFYKDIYATQLLLNQTASKIRIDYGGGGEGILVRSTATNNATIQIEGGSGVGTAGRFSIIQYNAKNVLFAQGDDAPIGFFINGVTVCEVKKTAFNIKVLPIFADNTAAASLSVGDIYRTATGELRVKY